MNALRQTAKIYVQLEELVLKAGHIQGNNESFESALAKKFSLFCRKEILKKQPQLAAASGRYRQAKAGAAVGKYKRQRSTSRAPQEFP